MSAKKIPTIRIYKDSWIPSRPWCADVENVDGTVWSGWQIGWKTKKEMMKNIECAANMAFGHHNYVVFRGIDQ